MSMSGDEKGRRESSSDIDEDYQIEKIKKKNTQEINADEREAVAEKMRRKASQFREEKIALYLLSASPLILYTPVDNLE